VKSAKFIESKSAMMVAWDWGMRKWGILIDGHEVSVQIYEESLEIYTTLCLQLK
jgi:hypothetical protein